MSEKLLINQSLVKDLLKYKRNQLCGLVFQNKWIQKQYGKSSEANDLGHYFEFLATGALAKGEVKGKEPYKNKKGEITTKFLLAKEQAMYYHKLIREYGITDVKAGEKVIAEDTWVGTLDIEATWNALFEDTNLVEKDPNNPNNRVIIDLKYSGLLDDKWSDFGWHMDFLGKKWGTMLQAKHYKFLFWKKYGFNPPFFFFVFDSAKVGVAKMIYVEITIDDLKEHEKLLKRAKKYLEEQMLVGFKPKPRYEECNGCDYNELCLFRKTTPPILTITPHNPRND